MVQISRANTHLQQRKPTWFLLLGELFLSSRVKFEICRGAFKTKHALDLHTMSTAKVFIEKVGQAPSPSKDFHQLVLNEKEVTWRTWRIAIRRDQRGLPPSQKKVTWDEFDDDTLLQSDISRVFGEETLKHVHAIVCGDWLVRLPPRVIAHIASFLDLVDIVHLGAVCKLTRKICASDLLWEKKFMAYCDIVTDEMKTLAREIGWRKVFFANKLELRVKLRRQKAK